MTALYFEGDQYLGSDAVFGVRKSLIVVRCLDSKALFLLQLSMLQKPEFISDVALSRARGFKEEKPHTYLKKDFVLATPAEVRDVKVNLQLLKLML